MDMLGRWVSRRQQSAPPSVRVPLGKGFKIQIFRLLTILFGIFVALIIAEIALRMVGWPTPGLYVGGSGPVTLRSPGRDGGAFPPKVRGELRHYDYDVECVVNSYGFRDAEIGSKQNGEWRVGILGDSFTAGIGVRQNERFADMFGTAIRRFRPNITVWNLGAPSCGTACEAEMLKGVDQKYQLDEIILAFYGGNDLEDNASWYANAADSPKSHEDSLAVEARGWLREHSRVATFVWVNGLRAWASFQPPGVYTQTDFNRYWPDTDRSLQYLLDIVGSKKMTILYLPAGPEWNDLIWEKMRSRYHLMDDQRYVVKRAVANWSQGHGVEFMDATDWLRGCESFQACVFPVDSHWNAHGHSLVAQGLLSQKRWAGPK
jgi:hypothetical protein